MSRPTWAVELAAADAESAQSLRLVHGVEARFSEDRSVLWLRGPASDEDTMRIIQQLPCQRRMTLMEDGRGIAEGKTVPSVRLTGSDWLPLRHLSPLQAPGYRNCSAAAVITRLQLTPSAHELPTEVLCLPFGSWFNYAINAPAIRLARLRFAVSEDRRAIIHGAPLPPLRGQFFHINCGIATPAGTSITPAVAPALLASQFHLNEGDILLLHLDETCELIDASDFAQASRSAVRETAGTLEAVNP